MAPIKSLYKLEQWAKHPNSLIIYSVIKSVLRGVHGNCFKDREVPCCNIFREPVLDGCLLNSTEPNCFESQSMSSYLAESFDIVELVLNCVITCLWVCVCGCQAWSPGLSLPPAVSWHRCFPRAVQSFSKQSNMPALKFPITQALFLITCPSRSIQVACLSLLSHVYLQYTFVQQRTFWDEINFPLSFPWLIILLPTLIMSIARCSAIEPFYSMNDWSVITPQRVSHPISNQL